MKFGLRNIRHLLEFVGNPERKFPSVHVGGTNGKGSTSAFLASIAMEAGYRTALYTSPHLVRFTERIRIDGKEIAERRLVGYVAHLRPAIEEVRATFFEATTCIAFQYFADEQVDLGVIEVGLGGRLDSTNVLHPLVSVITNVGMDHTEILGKTIRAIAKEKGGIIKPGVPCVTGSTDSGALAVVRKIAAAKKARLYQAQKLVKLSRGGSSSVYARFTSGGRSPGLVTPGLGGEFQQANAQVAMAVADVLSSRIRSRGTILFSTEAIRRGLRNVVRNTGIRGRLEVFGRSPRYVLDVAHNPPGMNTLVQSLHSRGLGNLVVVFGVMKDKDWHAMVGDLSRIAATVVAVASKGKRALRPQKLRAFLRSKAVDIVAGGSVARGLKIAGRIVKRGRPILVTGSHYVVGEAMEVLDRNRT
jgi:dihydrofolate synthase/folylpolyglutamate synthase